MKAFVTNSVSESDSFMIDSGLVSPFANCRKYLLSSLGSQFDLPNGNHQTEKSCW